MGGPPQIKYVLSMSSVQFNCTFRYFVLQGMPYSPMKFTRAPDAQCLQGVPYSPVKFTGAQMPNVCRGCRIPHEVHWGTRCPKIAGDATFPGEVHWGTRCPMFVGDAVFPGEVHWAPGAQFLQGIRMPSPTNYPASWYAVCIMYTQILKVAYHICSEMYH